MADLLSIQVLKPYRSPIGLWFVAVTALVEDDNRLGIPAQLFFAVRALTLESALDLCDRLDVYIGDIEAGVPVRVIVNAPTIRLGVTGRPPLLLVPIGKRGRLDAAAIFNMA